MKKLIITSAITGVGTSRKQTPYVPIDPDEIAIEVVEVAKAGAAIAHIHVRDESGKNSMEPLKFIEVINKVRNKLKENNVDIILNLTTSGSKWPEEKRLGHLPTLLPEMCSFDPGSMNWANSYVFLNPPNFLESLGNICKENRIKPELEIFDAGMLGNVEYYIKNKILVEPCHYQFVLGVPGGMPGNIESLAYLVTKIPKGSTWSITGIGKSHMSMMLAGLAAGCDGLRVGLEDNIYMKKGELATNVDLVKRAVKLGELVDRKIATAEEARDILGLIKHK